MNVFKLIRKDLKDFQPYRPPATLQQISEEIGVPVTDIIKVDSGENPYVEKFTDKKMIEKTKFFTYPDPFCLSLRKKLALYTKFPPEWIMCGNGSDELIDLLIRSCLNTGEEIIISPPTFPMYEFYGKLNRGKVKRVLRKKDLTVDTEKIVKAITTKTKLIFIDSPGNPSGTIISTNELRKLAQTKILVVIDEAYFEYCGETVAPLLKKYSNLVVLRTFSKWAGLAGLRIGYLVADPQLVNILLAIKSPYNVNAVAQMMAQEVLRRSKQYLSEIKKIASLRNLFIREISKIKNLKTYPSQGAYLICQPKTSAVKLQKFLAKKGIAIKVVDQPLLRNCFRINLGKEKEINRLIEFLKGFYEKI